jgi:hypothetical protein
MLRVSRIRPSAVHPVSVPGMFEEVCVENTGEGDRDRAQRKLDFRADAGVNPYNHDISSQRPADRGQQRAGRTNDHLLPV